MIEGITIKVKNINVYINFNSLFDEVIKYLKSTTNIKELEYIEAEAKQMYKNYDISTSSIYGDWDSYSMIYLSDKIQIEYENNRFNNIEIVLDNMDYYKDSTIVIDGIEKKFKIVATEWKILTDDNGINGECDELEIGDMRIINHIKISNGFIIERKHC